MGIQIRNRYRLPISLHQINAATGTRHGLPGIGRDTTAKNQHSRRRKIVANAYRTGIGRLALP